MIESVTWKKLIELAEEIRENPDMLTAERINEHGLYFEQYITSCSKESTHRAKARWLCIKKGEKEYKVEEKFYKKIIGVISEGRAKTPLTGDSATVLCYRISEMEKCSVEEVCDTLITLGLFPQKTMLKQKILDELKGDTTKKENLGSEQQEAGELSNQGGYDLPESGMDDVKQSEENAEDTKNVQLDILQYADKDNIPEIMEDDLKKFVTGFIEAMSYKIETLYPREHSSYSELLSVYLDESCVDELSIFHQHIKPWKGVLVTYFPSDTRDEEIQQEVGRIHKLDKKSRAFVIVACATDEMFRYVRKIAACDRQKSIMLLCYEHQDEAYICLKDKPKSDKERFEFAKPDSKEYFYI